MRQSYSLLLAFSSHCSTRCRSSARGTALVPWAVFTLLFGFPPKAIVLLALYLCTLITRNTLEPKLLSAQAGCRRSRRFLRCTSATARSAWQGWCSFPSSCCCSRRFETQKRKLPHKKENGENRSLFYCFLPACAAVVEQPVEELAVVSDIAGCAVSRRAGVVRRRLCAAVAASGGITARASCRCRHPVHPGPAWAPAALCASCTCRCTSDRCIAALCRCSCAPVRLQGSTK